MPRCQFHLRIRHRTIVNGSPIRAVQPYLGEPLTAIASDPETAIRISEANDKASQGVASEFLGQTMLTHGEPCVLRIVPEEGRGRSFCSIARSSSTAPIPGG